jgi:hypothetical protein
MVVAVLAKKANRVPPDFGKVTYWCANTAGQLSVLSKTLFVLFWLTGLHSQQIDNIFNGTKVTRCIAKTNSYVCHAGRHGYACC